MVDLLLNGEKIGTALTDNAGIATLKYMISNNVGKYLIDVVLMGDLEYKNVNSSGNLTVNPIKTHLVVNNINGYKGDIIKIKAVLSDENKHSIIGKTVNFFIGGKQIGSAVTDNNGTAWFVYKLLNTGIFTIHTTFEGNGIYAGSNGNGLLNVNLPSHLYLTGTTNNRHPKIGEKVKISYKVSIIGDNPPENVTASFKIPEGFKFVSAQGDGMWKYNSVLKTLIWSINSNDAEQNFDLFLKALEEGKYTITPVISSVPKINITNNAVQTINVQRATNKTNGISHSNKTSNNNAKGNINLPHTGVPIFALILGILLILEVW